MRGILVAIVAALAIGNAAPGRGAETLYESSERVRIRLPNSSRPSDDSRESAAAPEDRDASQWRPPSRRSRRQRESSAERAEVRLADHREPSELDADHESEPPDSEPHQEYSARSPAEHVQPVQFTTAQTLPGQVTLSAPTFDPYRVSPYATLYAPAAIPPAPGAAVAPPLAQPPYGPPPLDYLGSPTWGHRTGIFGEFLYLRPRNAEVPYAVPIRGPVLPILGNGIQIGPTASVDPGYQIAFAVGGAFALSETSSIRGRYSRFDQTTDDAVSIEPPDVLRSLVTHPLGMNIATDTLDASASYRLTYNLADLEYAGTLIETEKYFVNYFAGGRYLQFDQDFDAVFSTIGTTNVDTAIDFSGGGIGVGLEGTRRHCPTGCLVYARGASHFVVGEFEATYAQTDAAGVPIVASSFDAARIVPMLDLEVGAGWMSRNGRIRLAAGYMISAWFNMVTTPEFIEAVQVNNFDGLSDTLTFDGLTARATVQF